MADAARIAFVTGVSRGLGVALAAELGARGFEVVGIGRGAHASLGGPRFTLVRADLAETSGLDATVAPAFAAAAARSPAEVVLVNNAAVVEPAGTLGALPAEGIVRSLAVNLVAPAILVNAFLRELAGHAALRVVNVSSGLAARALPGQSLYCAAKAGLEMLTAVTAAEAQGRTTAASVRPGIIDTPMQATLRGLPPAQFPPVAMFRDFHASGRLQSPADTARFVVERLVLGDVAPGETVSYAP